MDSEGRKRAVNLVILGPEGSGKSSLGNALVGRTGALRVSGGMLSASDSEPRMVRSDSGCIAVAECPDVTQDADDREAAIEAVRRCLQKAEELWLGDQQGADIVAVTVRLDIRFTQEQKDCLSCLGRALGKECLARSGVVVFTHGDCIDNSEEKLVELVRRFRAEGGGTSLGLGELIDMCGGRFCMVDTSRGCERSLQQGQVDKLLELVDTSNAPTASESRYSRVLMISIASIALMLSIIIGRQVLDGTSNGWTLFWPTWCLRFFSR